MSPAVHRSSCCTEYIEQSGFVLPQVQLEQSPLQEHLINSMHNLESCRIVTQTGTHDSDTLVHANPAEKEPQGLLALVR